MYAFHRLCKNDQDFVFSFNGTARARSESVSFSIASVLVNSISFIKDSDKKFFDAEHILKLTEKFNSLNEILRIDLDKILGYAHKLYNFRVSFLSSSEVPNQIFSSESAVVDFFGVSRFFSKEDLVVITSNGPQIAIDSLRFYELLRTLGFFDE